VYGYSAIPLQDQVHAAKYAGSLFRCADLIAGKFFGYFRMLTGRIGMEEKIDCLLIRWLYAGKGC
jgi:hypothetical protein